VVRALLQVRRGPVRAVLLRGGCVLCRCQPLLRCHLDSYGGGQPRRRYSARSTARRSCRWHGGAGDRIRGSTA